MASLIDAVKAQFGNTLSSTKDALARLTAPARKIEARLAEIPPSQGKLLVDLAPPAELLPLYDRVEDELAIRTIEEYGPGIARELAGAASWTSPDNVTIGSPQVPSAFNVPMTFGMYLGFRRTREWLSQLPATMPMRDRLAALQELAREKQALLAEHARLCDEAAAAGVVIPHLAETVAARQAARFAQERAAHEQRDRDFHERVAGH
jgi:hypothetical protein